MQSISKTWPENTVENKIRWAAMKYRPEAFRMLHTTIKEVENFFNFNPTISLPQIAEEIAKLTDLLLCSGYRSAEENSEYAEETINNMVKSKIEFPIFVFFKKKKRQFWVVENFVRKYGALWAEKLKEIDPTFDLAYLISYAANAFHFRIGNCGEHAILTLTLILCGGMKFLRANEIYCAEVIITYSNSNHAQVLLVRGKRLAEIIKNYFTKRIEAKDWEELINNNSEILKNYEERKNMERKEEKEKAAEMYHNWLRENISTEYIDAIYRELKDEDKDNAYIADGFWGKAEHPQKRIEDPRSKNFKSVPFGKSGTVPDLKVLFCKILYDYKDLLLKQS